MNLIAEMSFPKIPFSQVLLYAMILLAVMLGISLVSLLTHPKKIAERHHRNWLSRLLYAVFIALTGILGLTSFGSILRFGHMSGYALLMHVGAAGAFVFLLLVLAILYLPRATLSGNERYAAEGRWWLARWSAWAFILGGIVAAGTMFLSMLPLLDTTGLLTVAEIHRYAGLVVVMAASLHCYSLFCVRLGLR